MVSRILGGSASVLEWIAAIALTMIMLLTSCDIIGRVFGVPVPGTFEVVSFAAGIIIGLAIPMSQKVKAQVTIDAVTDIVPGMIRSTLRIITRLIGMATFSLMAYAMIGMANDLRVSGELTSVLRIPFYPVAYAMSAAFAIQVVLLGEELGGELMKKGGEQNV